MSRSQKIKYERVTVLNYGRAERCDYPVTVCGYD